MLVHRADGRSVHGNALTPKACHRAYPDIQVAQGNHFVRRPSARLPQGTDHPLQIVHYSLRSVAQLERRIRRGAATVNSGMNPTSAKRWQRLYGKHLQPGGADIYYRERAPTPDQVEAGLANGTLTRDTRIRDALRQLDPALVDPASGP